MHALQVLHNTYGFKQSPQVWNKYLHDGLCKMGFKPTEIDPSLSCQDDIVFLVYIDDGVLLTPNIASLD